VGSGGWASRTATEGIYHACGGVLGEGGEVQVGFEVWEDFVRGKGPPGLCFPDGGSGMARAFDFS